MIKIIFKTVALISLVIFSVSCSDEVSLERYYVESENKSDILMLDIPTSMLVFDDKLSTEANDALASIDKLNVLAFKLNKDNKVNYIAENAKVNKILSNKNYKELVKINNNGSKFVVKYLGTDAAMDEVVVYANDKTKGFALGRLLGNDMKPEHMVHLMESVKEMDSDNQTFKVLENFFKN